MIKVPTSETVIVTEELSPSNSTLLDALDVHKTVESSYPSSILMLTVYGASTLTSIELFSFKPKKWIGLATELPLPHDASAPTPKDTSEMAATNVNPFLNIKLPPVWIRHIILEGNKKARIIWYILM